MASLQYTSHQTTSVSNKRKREENHPMQAPTANMNDTSDTGYLSGHQDHSGLDHSQFDLSDLHHADDNAMNQNGDNHPGDASDTAAAALSHYSMSIGQSGDQPFLTSGTGNDPEHQLAQYSMSSHNDGQNIGSEFTIDADETSGHGPNSPKGTSGRKPPVGSAEWHKVRKDNHKEVERRRRETINEGINELQKIVPNCDKNKGGILARAVQFITQLKDNEQANIEKWTLEKLLAEQAINELSARHDSLLADLQRLRAETSEWKRVAKDAGADMASAEASVAAALDEAGYVQTEQDGEEEGNDDVMGNTASTTRVTAASTGHTVSGRGDGSEKA